MLTAAGLPVQVDPGLGDLAICDADNRQATVTGVFAGVQIDSFGGEPHRDFVLFAEQIVDGDGEAGKLHALRFPFLLEPTPDEKLIVAGQNAGQQIARGFDTGGRDHDAYVAAGWESRNGWLIRELGGNVSIAKQSLRVHRALNVGKDTDLNHVPRRARSAGGFRGLELRFGRQISRFEVAAFQLGIVAAARNIHQLAGIEVQQFFVAEPPVVPPVVVGSELHLTVNVAGREYTSLMYPTTARALFLLAAPLLALAGDFNGTWDATIMNGSDPVAFRMEVSEAPMKVCFFEDAQPVCSTSARVEGTKLVAQWDFLRTDLRLEAQDKTLTGVYHLYRSNRDMNVEARPHQQRPASSEPPAKFEGEWEARNVDRPSAATWQLLLRQSGSDLKGTILRVDGDDGTLVGRVEGKHFSISHFSGDRPVVLTGDLKPDGSLEMKLGRTNLVALRPADARARSLAPPPDPATWARVKNSEEPFHFRFPDVNGREYSEADFRGKPLIVTITGSWCPNCRDEAPFLGELYERYHGKGLEIVALCFEEASDAPEHGQLRSFVRKFGIKYPALLAGEPSGLKTQVPQIENLTAFPSSIYVGRDGRVRTVHTGFPSGGSGEELTRVKSEIRELVERMIAEPIAAAR